MEFDLPAFVARCRRASLTSNLAQALRKELDRAIAQAPILTSAFAGREEPEACLFESDSLTIFDVRVDPGIRYPSHNHGMAVLIGVYDGCEVNTIYQLGRGDTAPKAAGEIEIHAGVSRVLAHDVIHSVACLGDSPSRALHIYLGNLTRVERTIWSPATGEAHPFSEDCYFGFATKA
ncbi:MAG: hypothetical protein Pars2KO_10780 [Parasphingorhabdus sp.]